MTMMADTSPGYRQQQQHKYVAIQSRWADSQTNVVCSSSKRHDDETSAEKINQRDVQLVRHYGHIILT